MKDAESVLSTLTNDELIQVAQELKSLPLAPDSLVVKIAIEILGNNGHVQIEILALGYPLAIVLGDRLKQLTDSFRYAAELKSSGHGGFGL